MSVWRQLRYGLRALFHRRDVNQEMADELGHFEHEATEELIEQGVSPDTAGRSARMWTGNQLAVRDQVLASSWEHMIETLVADIRYGIRRLWASPPFSLVAIVILALGIGASTAIFSAVSPILFEPLRYPEPHRVMAIWDRGPAGRIAVTFGTFRELVARNRTFASVAVFREWQPTITGGGEAERLDGQRVSADYFRVLGVTPILGRDFQSTDDVVSGPRLVILSDGAWRRKFDGDPAVLGRAIKLDDLDYTVIGVMPPTFENAVASDAGVWTPLQYDATLPVQGREWGHHLQMIGRLRAGATTEAARTEMNTIARTPLADFPRVAWAVLGNGLLVTPLQEDLTGAIRPALLAVLAAVMLVLIMACVNVANLALARGLRRREEFAMRAALGAGRWRLTRQVITEGLLLSALGGALGVVLAMFGVKWLMTLSPLTLPQLSRAVVDVNALFFAFGVSTVIGVVVGLMPLRYASAARIQGGLRINQRQSTGRHGAAGHALVVAEVALALMLLVSAGLLVRTLQNLFAISPGFDTRQMLTMQVQASGRRFDREAVHRFYEGALEAARRVPGVTAAAMVSQLPLSGDQIVFGAAFERSPDVRDDTGFPVFRYAVTPGYFSAIDLPLRSGRVLNQYDTTNAQRVIVVSESFATRFPGGQALGQRVYIGPTNLPPYTVVGVVGNVRQASLEATSTDAVYMTARQWHFADNVMWLVARTSADPARMSAAVREAIWSVDRDQPIVRIATMASLLAQSAGERRFAMILFELFAIVAIALVATGLYGVIANSVDERRKEIGVRLALGASRGEILRMVIAQGLIVVGIGIGIGAMGAIATTSGMVSLLFGVSYLDSATYSSVVGLLLGIAMIACGLPGWRATRVDPAITLRAE